jgi:hypothetical protein
MIILLGLPKSGTTSFNTLFHNLNYETYHWKYNNKYIGSIINNNIKNNKPLLSTFSNASNNVCITQMDCCIDNNNNFWHQITHYKELYEQNKDAIFILNKRDKYKILNSFKKWTNSGISLISRILQYNPELFQSRKTNDVKILTMIDNHYNNIEFFFKTKPNAKFIIYDIEKDNITKLNQYIDTKNITKLPHSNININSNINNLAKAAKAI